MQNISTFPRALRRGSAVQANSDDPQAIFTEIKATLRNMKGDLNTAINAKLDPINETVTNLTSSMSAIQDQVNGSGMGGGSGNNALLPVEPEYTRAFADYARKGGHEEDLRVANASGQRASIQAAMSVGDNSNGGYLAPSEWDRKLHERQRATSPLRRMASVQLTSVGEYHTLWNTDEFGSGWVGETAARPQTSTASLAQIQFAAGDIYANVAITQRLLDDAAFNVESWLADRLQAEFNRQENIAFISGDGVNKPCGLLTYVAGGVNETRHPGGPVQDVEAPITYDGLVDFAYGLGAPYRQNAAWLMSSLTAAHIAKLKDGNGNPIWREGLIAGQPATLLGRVVEIEEALPGPEAGNLAIAFGDFKAGYLINDRTGVRILRDPYSNKPFVMFYNTKRVGAGVLDPFALRFLRVSA